MDELEKSPITGTEIAYLYICHRKLWLFRKGIRPENEHTNVQIGKFIQESTFLRHMNKKEVPLGHIGRVDWAELDKGVIVDCRCLIPRICQVILPIGDIGRA
jgi:CRISPR-associated exonuclease Cas4